MSPLSTKVTRSSFARTARLPGFHLYDDTLDYFGDSDLRSDAPIYLKLEGVDVAVETLATGGVSVTLKVPRDTAVDLGLIKWRLGAWKCA
jgi:hypothetical protein